MSSINPYFTFTYSQPDEYRFSHDSVFLARQVFELYTKEQIRSLRVLDLCSGCGIIGLDFLFHCQKELGVSPLRIDFLEIQEAYRSHFATNCERLGPTSTQIQFIQKNYESLLASESAAQYDLVLCNPPYFFLEMGRLSPSEFKNRCRFYLDSDFEKLVTGIAHCLARPGQAYVLLRDLQQHGWNSLKETKRLLRDCCNVELLGDIRGTHLVKLSKDNHWSLQKQPTI